MRALLVSILLLTALGLGPGFTCSGQGQGAKQDESEDAQAVSEQASQDAPATPQVRTPADERTVARRLEDASIGAQVQLALADNSSLQPFAFETEVHDGRVVLRGNVRTRAQYNEATEVARDVEGVTDVVNQVLVAGQEVATLEPEEPARARHGTATADSTEPVLAHNEAAPAGTEEQETASAQAPEAEPEDTAEAQPPSEVYHTVKNGESLWTIAEAYGVTISQIRQFNDLRSDNIRPGQRLRVK